LVVETRSAVAGWLAGGLLVSGVAGLSAMLDGDDPSCAQTSLQRPAHAHGHGHGAGEVITGPTCNTVETAIPAASTYVPSLRKASAADLDSARRLLDGVNEFCRGHSVARLQQEWPPRSDPATATHFFNPDPGSVGLDPANPRAALIYDGRLGGVMFTGRPLDFLGSVPRPHSHDAARPVEMLHVYCTSDLAEAFTPNRQLGVNSDLRPLRQAIRPALVGLPGRALRAVLARARAHAGDRLLRVTPVEPSREPGPDPVLQAMRREVRASLPHLTEPQLREVWASVRRY
jgi:hypothetical protein